MSVKKLVIQNTIAQIGARFVSMSATFFITLLIARVFGVTGFGEFTKIVSYVSIFYLLSDFGLNAIFVGLARDEKQEIKVQMSNFLLLRIIGALLLVGILIVLLTLFPHGSTQGFTPLVRTGIVLFSVTVVSQAIVTTCNAFFQKTLSYHFLTIAVFIGSVTSIALSLWVVIRSFESDIGILLIIASLTVGYFAMAISSLRFVYKELGGFSFSPDYVFVKTLLKKGWLLGLTLFAGVAIAHSDRFILTLARSTEEVGIYGLAYKFFEFPRSLPTFFMNSVFPLFVLDRRKNIVRLARRIKRSFFVLFFSSLVVAILLYLAAPLLVFIKSDFAASVPIFRLLSLFLPLFFLSSLTMWLLVLFEYRKLLFATYALFAVAHVAAGIFFIPQFGNSAAAALVGATEAGILITSAGILFIKQRKVIYAKQKAI